MCTVTFVPVKTGFLLTSNRDEKNNRQPALHPKAYTHGSTRIIYPKDVHAGGTWVAMKASGDAAVLLNGAFKKHTPRLPYAQSRGIILLSIFESQHPVDAFLKIKLEKIEPFTLILFVERLLTECRWDGMQKHVKQLSNKNEHIWSSATLYTDDIVLRREDWFRKFLIAHREPTVTDIFNFHRFAGDGDLQNDLTMKREDVYQTVSITTLQLETGNERMIYRDLINDSYSVQEINTHAPEPI